MRGAVLAALLCSVVPLLFLVLFCLPIYHAVADAFAALVLAL